MDCSRNEACKNKSIMFLDLALFVFNIKRVKNSIPALANGILVSSVGKRNAGNGAIIGFIF